MRDFGMLIAAPHGRFDGIERPYSVRGRAEAARIGADRAYARPPRRAEAVGAAPPRTSRSARSARVTGNQAMQMVRAGPEGDLPLRLAGRRRLERRRLDVPRPVALPGQFRPRACHEDQQDPAARRPDRASRRRREARLVRADPRRRRGRLRRPAELLRDHEGLYRGGRRGRSLRGPARQPRRSAATWAARC